MPKRLDPTKAEAVMLKAGLKPLEPYKSTTAKWKCLHTKCGKVVFSVYASVRRGQGGCYECGRRQSETSRRLPEKQAVEIMIKAGMKPLEPYKNAVSRWKSQCLNCGSIGYPQLNMINYGQGGCRPCSFKKTGLASRISEKEAKEKLRKLKLKFAKKYRWHDKREMFQIICLICGKISNTCWDTLLKKGRQPGCRTCSRKAASFQQVNEEKHKSLLAEHNLEPLGKYTGNKNLVAVKCLLCNKRRQMRRSILLARKVKLQGCMTCAGARIADHKKIERVMKKAKLKPLVPYHGGHKPWKCTCLKCKRIVFPEFNSILSGQGGCIYCAEIGFNYKNPAILYLIENYEMGSIKVGITNVSSKPDRLKQFQSLGWLVHKKYEFRRGIQAFKVEQEILKWLRVDLKLPKHLAIEQMPKTGGHSETVSADSITVLRLSKKIEQIIKGYKK